MVLDVCSLERRYDGNSNLELKHSVTGSVSLGHAQVTYHLPFARSFETILVMASSGL